MEYKVSDTTLRARRDEWIATGVFAELEAETRAAYDRVIGLDLSFVAIDGSIHKAPCGGEETGKSLFDRAKLGHKWSIAADANGIPIGVALAGANRNDIKLLKPTLASIISNGLIDDIELLALDSGYDYPVVRQRLAVYDLTELEIQKRGTRPPPGTPHRLTLGLRWIVEALDSGCSNYGQLRQLTDRNMIHRYAAISLATIVLMTARLIDYCNRWSPTPAPIR